jgi:hypothetical protein
VAIALENFFNAKSAVAQGAWASDYELARKPIARGELVPVTRAKGKSSVALAPIKEERIIGHESKKHRTGKGKMV